MAQNLSSSNTMAYFFNHYNFPETVYYSPYFYLLEITPLLTSSVRLIIGSSKVVPPPQRD